MLATHPSGPGDLDDPAAHVPTEPVDDNARVTVDLVRQYLNEAGGHQLLTREGEADLTKRYRAGSAAASMLADSSQTCGREDRLRRIMRDGQRAHEKMIGLYVEVVDERS